MAPVRLEDFQDLEDLAMFAAIVDAGGVNAAARLLALPKSRLSRHLTALEQRYNVELAHRSTRRFALSAIGSEVYQQSKIVIDALGQSRGIMASSQKSPQGQLRVSAPSPLANFWLAPLLPRFLEANPAVSVELEGHERDLDLIDDRIDLAIRIRPTPLQDSDLVIRHLGNSRQVLVAAPDLLAKHGPLSHPSDLDDIPLIGFSGRQGMTEWRLRHSSGEPMTLTFRPRLATFELVLLLEAALAGTGIALLPEHFCRVQLRSGALVRPLLEWCGPTNSIHAAYLSRRMLPSSARALIDFLVRELPSAEGLVATEHQAAEAPVEPTPATQSGAQPIGR